MNIVIRCDIGGNHGFGHAVRMKALAQALTARGADVAFTSNTRMLLEEFVAPYACGDCETITHLDLDCLIVDTTDPIEESWYRRCADAMGAKRVVRIDHPQASEGSCDLLIGPCAHWAEDTVQTLRTSFGDRFLYGWDYVMLAQAVGRISPLPVRHASRFGIVFCAGGSDPTSALDVMLEWSIHLETSAPLLFLRPCSQSRYLRAIRHASLVVGMFGVTGYESLWCGTPILLYARTVGDAEDARRLQDISQHHVYAGGVLADSNAQTFCAMVQEAYYASIGSITAVPVLLDRQGTARVANAILALC